MATQKEKKDESRTCMVCKGKLEENNYLLCFKCVSEINNEHNRACPRCYEFNCNRH